MTSARLPRAVGFRADLIRRHGPEPRQQAFDLGLEELDELEVHPDIAPPTGVPVDRHQLPSPTAPKSPPPSCSRLTVSAAFRQRRGRGRTRAWSLAQPCRALEIHGPSQPESWDDAENTDDALLAEAIRHRRVLAYAVAVKAPRPPGRRHTRAPAVFQAGLPSLVRLTEAVHHPACAGPGRRTGVHPHRHLAPGQQGHQAHLPPPPRCTPRSWPCASVRPTARSAASPTTAPSPTAGCPTAGC